MTNTGALARLPRAIAIATADAPRTETVALMRELANRAAAFALFGRSTASDRTRRDGTELAARLQAAAAHGPQQALFLTEGIGYQIADQVLRRTRPARRRSLAIPPGVTSGAAASLHVGLGLRFAQDTLRREACDHRALDDYLLLWTTHADPEWQPIGAEPLGFAARLLCPDRLWAIGGLVAQLGRGGAEFFRHGSGRALYFLPDLMTPICGAHAHAMWMAKNTAPSPIALRNEAAGWAWAMTLTNLQQPELIEDAIVHACEAAPPIDALAAGVAGALTMVRSALGSDRGRLPIAAYRPESRHASRLWRMIVGRACTVSAARALTPAAFRYGPR